MFRVLLSVHVAVVLLATSLASAQRPGGFMLANAHGSDAEEAAEAMPLVPKSTSVQEKDPWLAFLLSFALTGSGQVYNNQVGKGVLQFAGASAGLGLVISEAENDREDSNWTQAGAGLMLACYLWSVIDAPVTANRINREARQASIQIDPVLRDDLAGASLTFRF